MHFNLHDPTRHFLEEREGLGKRELKNTGENEALVQYVNTGKQEAQASFIGTSLPRVPPANPAGKEEAAPSHDIPNMLAAIFT